MTAQTLFCERCDTRNPDDAHFCVICGTPLGKNAPSQHAPVAPPPVPAATRPAPAPYGYVQPNMYSQYAPAPALAGSGGTFVQNIYVNGGAPAVVTQKQTVNLLIRAIWFLFVGLWIGQAWLLLAWLFNLTLVGLPLGLWMLNKMPQIMTLRSNEQPMYLQTNGGVLQARPAGAPFAVRAVYFVLVGWWVSFLWMQLAWLASASLIGLPLSFLMFERTATVATLGD